MSANTTLTSPTFANVIAVLRVPFLDLVYGVVNPLHVDVYFVSAQRFPKRPTVSLSIGLQAFGAQ